VTLHWNSPEDFPEDFERFHDYCDDDVRTEVEAHRRMIPLSTEEQELFVLDQRINDRGIRIDIKSAFAAIELAEKARAKLNDSLYRVTGHAIDTYTAVEQLTAWIRGENIRLPSLAKADVDAILKERIPEHVQRAIELRQEAAKTSVSKLQTFLDRCSKDGRIRGAFLFSAAGTGRWSSVGAQLHNLPRPRKQFSDAHLDARTLFQAIRLADPEWLKFLYGDEIGKTLHLLADAIRGFIWAAPGHDLLVADYTGIEGAVQAWFAGEQWKLDAMFGVLADPTLPDMYRRTAAGIYGISADRISKKDNRRQVGKVAELAFGYQGGVGAMLKFAQAYGLDLDEIFDSIWDAAIPDRCERAEDRYDECFARNEMAAQHLSREAWLAAELVKVGWRATNPAIAASWKLLEGAIWEAILNPGQKIDVLRAAYLVKNGFLWCRLPSGRCLAYGKPAIREMIVPWADPEEDEDKRERRPMPTALGVNSVTKKWERFALYGGLAFENIVQAIARDLLANGIRKAEAAGYPVIGHVHDEIITEVPRGWGDVGTFERLICELPAWADGLPLTASGWRGKRYRKD
jgi:DNA polymerase